MKGQVTTANDIQREGPVRHFSLTEQFTSLIEQFHRDTKSVERYIQTLQGVEYLQHVPVWDETTWQTRHANCYNFALNAAAPRFAYPGDISSGGHSRMYGGWQLGGFRNHIMRNAEKDGLIPVGGSFRKAIRLGVPAALFVGEIFSDEDDDSYLGFHWAALRRDENGPVWAHKPGSQPAEKITDTDIYLPMRLRGYTQFCGFYAVPFKKQL